MQGDYSVESFLFRESNHSFETEVLDSNLKSPS